MTNEKKIYMTTFSVVRYLRAEEKSDALAALAEIVHAIAEKDDEWLLHLTAEEVSAEEVKDLEVEDADDHLIGA